MLLEVPENSVVSSTHVTLTTSHVTLVAHKAVNDWAHACLYIALAKQEKHTAVPSICRMDLGNTPGNKLNMMFPSSSGSNE